MKLLSIILVVVGMGSVANAFEDYQYEVLATCKDKKVTVEVTKEPAGMAGVVVKGDTWEENLRGTYKVSNAGRTLEIFNLSSDNTNQAFNIKIECTSPYGCNAKLLAYGVQKPEKTEEIDSCALNTAKDFSGIVQ